MRLCYIMLRYKLVLYFSDDTYPVKKLYKLNFRIHAL